MSGLPLTPVVLKSSKSIDLHPSSVNSIIPEPTSQPFGFSITLPFKTLANNSINILAISTSEIKISVLIEKKFTELAVKSLHEVYKF